MTWQEIDDGTWDKDEGYLSKQKNEKSRMLGIKECEYFSKLIFKSLFSIHDRNFDGQNCPSLSLPKDLN